MAKQLEEYDFPNDLKEMSIKELRTLATQIRKFLVKKVSKTGGHLASNLGIVELTIALHKVFHSPDDKLLWDVGHQSYVHKILTGRQEGFDTLRQLGGMSGFPKREESVHDVYDAGHSSDSISVGFGIAKARDLKKESFSVVSIIGDGALTGGVAYEALNNVGNCGTKMIVILNDNQMSISENIGGVSEYLSKLRTTHLYTNLKKNIRNKMTKIPVVGQGLYKGLEGIRDKVKYTMIDNTMFEELGFRYYGPINGHNIGELISFLEAIQEMDEPVFLHVVTKKGKGVPEVEQNPDVYHGIGPFNQITFQCAAQKSPTYSTVFGCHLTELAALNPELVAISAAMVDATGLKYMAKEYPKRVFDVGIAEQHAVSFASGLALQGMKPFVAIYSTFLQRAYDEIMTNVCLQNLPVVFCVDRAGNVGEDGETHHGQFDLAYLLSMPNMRVMAPKDGKELQEMMNYALTCNGPCAIRYPRGIAEDYSEISDNYLIDGKSEKLVVGEKVTIFALGKSVGIALQAAKRLEKNQLNVSVINSRFAKPLDEEIILKEAKKSELLVTIEDHSVVNGFGNAVTRFLVEKVDYQGKILNIGWPDTFIPHGKTHELEKKYNLDGKSVAQEIKKAWQEIKENERKA